MNPTPKVKPIRSNRYLDFIRSKTCAWCNSRIEVQAAHQSLGNKGTGSKVSDLQAIPLCASCHREEHQKGRKFKDIGFVAILCVGYINEYFTNGGKL